MRIYDIPCNISFSAPTKAPLEFNAVDVTYNSAVLNWKPIPVPDLQGFLKHYEICITANINQKGRTNKYIYNLSVWHLQSNGAFDINLKMT